MTKKKPKKVKKAKKAKPLFVVVIVDDERLLMNDDKDGLPYTFKSEEEAAEFVADTAHDIGLEEDTEITIRRYDVVSVWDVCAEMHFNAFKKKDL